jgi:cytochrome P450
VTTIDDDPIDYNPIDYEIDARAHAVWRRMRDEAPLYRNDRYDFWALSRYDDVLPAMLDTATFSSAEGTTIELLSAEMPRIPMMIFMDPPEQTWHRQIVSRAFTVRTMSRLAARITTLCNDLLDGVRGKEEFDFLADYGSVIPPTMILALLGFPEGFEREWRDSVNAGLTVAPDGTHTTPPLDERGRTGMVMGQMPDPESLIEGEGLGMAKLFEVLPGLLAERRAEPQDDLMSVLVNSQLDEGGTKRPLEDAEIFSFLFLIASAGTETVGRLLGWVATLFDQHPDQRQMLVDDPSLIENAIEECLRYEAPSPVNGRRVTRDVEFHGQTVPQGASLLLLNGSANRDERHFPDGDRFDIRRRIDRHLSFGYGAHFCIGAALARLEGQIALGEFLKRYPTWDVDYDRAEMVHTTTVRGYAKVPVRVHP